MLLKASSEEINDSFSNRVARADLEKLLGVDQDDPNNYADENADLDEEEDIDLEFDFTDAEMEPPPEPGADGRGLPRQAEGADLPPPPVPKRVRRKGPGEGAQSAMMLKKCLTERSREKQREKELPWHCIPPELHQAFKQAENKQITEHYDHSALTPLTAAESDVIRATIPSDRILTSRFAYKDKNYARRKLSKDIEWRPKARLVVGGHKDPDAPYLATNAPTISRLAVLSILQVVASRQKQEDPWIASAGDVASAFLNGPPLQRLLYLQQPASVSLEWRKAPFGKSKREFLAWWIAPGGGGGKSKIFWQRFGSAGERPLSSSSSWSWIRASSALKILHILNFLLKDT